MREHVARWKPETLIFPASRPSALSRQNKPQADDCVMAGRREILHAAVSGESCASVQQVCLWENTSLLLRAEDENVGETIQRA